MTHDEMKGVTLTADKLLYLHAIDLCLNAASLEFFGKAQEVSLSRRAYSMRERWSCLLPVHRTVHSSASVISQFKSTSNHRL